MPLIEERGSVEAWPLGLPLQPLDSVQEPLTVFSSSGQTSVDLSGEEVATAPALSFRGATPKSLAPRPIAAGWQAALELGISRPVPAAAEGYAYRSLLRSARGERGVADPLLLHSGGRSLWIDCW